jgi:hypothetical protein
VFSKDAEGCIPADEIKYVPHTFPHIVYSHLRNMSNICLLHVRLFTTFNRYSVPVHLSSSSYNKLKLLQLTNRLEITGIE